eukprot:1464857-Rhodomonas_salina.8
MSSGLPQSQHDTRPTPPLPQPHVGSGESDTMVQWAAGNLNSTTVQLAAPIARRTAADCAVKLAERDFVQIAGMPGGPFRNVEDVKKAFSQWGDDTGFRYQTMFAHNTTRILGTCIKICCDCYCPAKVCGSVSLSSIDAGHRPNTLWRGCGCKFKMELEVCTSSSWIVTSVASGHTGHAAELKEVAGRPSASAMRHAANGGVPLHLEALMDELIALGICRNALYHHMVLACSNRGITPTFSPQDLRNRSNLLPGTIDLDASNLFDWVQKRRDEGQSGFVHHPGGFLRHAFFNMQGAQNIWSGQAKSDANTLIVDTTHLKMCYSLKLMLFVTINHN